MSVRAKKLLFIAAAVLCVAVAAGIIQSRLTFRHDSVDWRILADDRFSLDPGQIHIGYEIPRAPRYGVWPNFEVESKYPVTLGFVSAAYSDLMPIDLQDRMVPIRCEVKNIRKTLLACSELNRKESYLFFILDERGPGDSGNNPVHVQYTARMCFTCKNP